jgi:hypothetical protein
MTSTEIFCPVLNASLWVAINHLSAACDIRGKPDIKKNNKEVTAFALIYNFLLSICANILNNLIIGRFLSIDRQPAI